MPQSFQVPLAVLLSMSTGPHKNIMATDRDFFQGPKFRYRESYRWLQPGKSQPTSRPCWSCYLYFSLSFLLHSSLLIMTYLDMAKVSAAARTAAVNHD
jgi:hypothetical protein